MPDEPQRLEIVTLTTFIIVVLFRSGDTLPTLWQVLGTQTHDDWHLVLIDNDPAETTGRTLAELNPDRITYHANPGNQGFARAVNTGIRLVDAANGERCILLNPDVSFEPDFLSQFSLLWDRLGADVIAPRIMRTDGSGKAHYAGGFLDYNWVFTNQMVTEWSLDPPYKVVDFASGCCLGLSITMLRKVGLLDESFFVYWEDTDFCMRVKAADYPIYYVSGPVLLHESGASSGGDQTSAALRLYYRSYAQLLRKHFGYASALSSVGRIARREMQRPDVKPRMVATIISSLFQGLWTRQRAVPRLTSAS